MLNCHEREKERIKGGCYRRKMARCRTDGFQNQGGGEDGEERSVGRGVVKMQASLYTWLSEKG